MLVDIRNDIQTLHNLGVLRTLLKDRTTNRNIIWATDAYNELGTLYAHDAEIMSEQVVGTTLIQVRALKAKGHQKKRTKTHAEVATPVRICKQMIDMVDDEWWKKRDGNESVGDYISATRLEMACGEAPFLVSRYDSETGELIPFSERIGMLDRKLRLINQQPQFDKPDWWRWAKKAYQAIYGGELQGDNLLIARINLLMTFRDCLWERWDCVPTLDEYWAIAEIISWNLWQMDFLTGCIPYKNGAETPCMIYDHDTDQPVRFLDLFHGDPVGKQSKKRRKIRAKK